VLTLAAWVDGCLNRFDVKKLVIDSGETSEGSTKKHCETLTRSSAVMEGADDGNWGEQGSSFFLSQEDKRQKYGDWRVARGVKAASVQCVFQYSFFLFERLMS
jgi:hypothetical protein